MMNSRRAAFGILGATVALAAVLVGRTLLLVSRQEVVAQAGPAEVFDEPSLAARLGRAIRIPTISQLDAANPAVFDELRALLRELYPRTFAAARVEEIEGGSLLLTWEGRDRMLNPLLLLAHMDVVPVAPGTEKDWSYPPFSGEIAGDYVWGRGTLDDKSSVLGLLEAVEALLAEGAKPRRTVILAFGHDEEIGGAKGAQVMARLLEERGIEAELVLDEGGVVGIGLFDGITRPTAAIGTAEKGYLSVELTVTGKGGHSSMPPEETTIGRLSRAVSLVEATPMRARVRGALKEMLLTLAPESSFERRLAIANLWLFEPLLVKALSSKATTRAMLRTTAAPTIFQAGEKDNVLAMNARAVVNMRLLPGDTVQDAIAHVTKVVRDDEVRIRPIGTVREASSVSSTDSSTYKDVARLTRRIFPDAIVTPYLTVGGTDSSYYARLSPNVYRFLPVPFTADDIARLHGTNERIRIQDYANVVRFYKAMIRDAAL